MNCRVLKFGSCAWVLFAVVSSSAWPQSKSDGTSGGRSVILTELKPVQGEWDLGTDITIGGRLFDKGSRFHISRNGHRQIVFKNDSSYSVFESWVGWLGETDPRKGTFQFIVYGDGQELVRSPQLRDSDAPFKLHVNIADKRAIMLVTESNSEIPVNSSAIWGMPRFIERDVESKPDDSSKGVNGPLRSTADQQKAVFGTKVLHLDADALEKLVSDLQGQVTRDSALPQSRTSLAIAMFKLIPAAELSSVNAENLREDLTTAIIKTKAFDVVERGQLEKALDELKLGLTDVFDSENAKRLGKWVSARFVLIGSISDRGNAVVVNARIIDTATGRIPVAANVKMNQ